MTTAQLEEDLSSALIADFRLFLQGLWLEQGYNKHSPLGDVEYDIAHWMQHSPDRAGTLAFRGVGKSHLGDARDAWEHWKAVQAWGISDAKVMIVSASLGKAKDNLHIIRGWFDTTSFLRVLRPRNGQRDGAEKLDVGPAAPAKDPSFSAYGVSGQIVGSRASLIDPDDVETNESAMTRDLRLRLRERVKEFDAIVLPKGRIHYRGTPQHEETLYLELAKSGYVFRSWPARLPTEDEEKTIVNLAPILKRRLQAGEKPGTPTCPHRFDDEDLAKREASFGRSGFAMQFMLSMGMSDLLLYPLRLADFIVFPVNRENAPCSIAWGTSNERGSTAVEDIPSVGLGQDQFYAPIFFSKDWAPYSRTVAALDPAGGGGDEMAWAIASGLHGYVWLKTVEGVHGGATPQNLDRLARSLRYHGATELVVETNFDEAMVPLLQITINRYKLAPGEKDDRGNVYPAGWACTVTGERSTGQKELRIIGRLEPVMNQHRLIIDRLIAMDTVFCTQLTRITRARNCLAHDDRLEAASKVVSMFQSDLEQDPDRSAEQRREHEQQGLLERWMQLVGIRQPGTPRYFQIR